VRNLGKGASVKKGALLAQGDCVAFSDADLSVPIEEISRIMPFLGSGYDVVVGSRALAESNILKRQPWFRQTMGKIFNLLIRMFVLKGIKDTQCGFKCFKAGAAQRIFSLIRLNGFSFDVEALYIARLLGYAIKEVPVTWVNRKDSRVRLFRDSSRMFADLFRIKFNALRGLYG
jgi:dolichyl-phosphate beta-glucosyltransferase